jgi:uncharacterized protein
VSLYERGCLLGSQYSCVNLGRSYTTGRGVPKDDVRASAIFREACEAGSALACGSLGNWFIQVAADFTRGKPLLEQSCNAGVGEMCTVLGYAYDEGLAPVHDLRRAVALYQRACELDSASGCFNLACVLQEEGKSKQANPIDERGCALGDMTSCLRAGMRFANGDAGRIDDAQAVEYLTKACTAEVALACSELGFLYDNGRQIPQNFSRAHELWMGACDKGVGNACQLLGFAFRDGRGETKDLARAVSLLTRSCELDPATGCSELGLLCETGDGVAKDMKRAIALYRKGCAAGDFVGCNNIGFLYENGDGVPRDAARARGYYAKACELGSPESCSNHALMLAWGIGGPADERRAFATLKPLCDKGGVPHACAVAGELLVKGKVMRNPAVARSYLKLACKQGQQNSCAELKALDQATAKPAAKTRR